MSGKFKKVNAIIILPSILLFQLINNYIWLKLDKTYLLFDSHWHFLLSLKVFDVIKSFPIPLLPDVFNNFTYHRWHGMLVSFITAPFYFIFGVSQDIGIILSNTIFLSILIVSTYGIGKKIFNKQTGMLAAFLVSMYPLIFNQLRVYMLDVPLTAVVALSVYLLLLTDNFTKGFYSLLFGISVGLGMLTKFNFAGFIIGPLCLVLSRTFFLKQRSKKCKSTQNRNIFTVLLIAILISSMFYALKLGDVLNRVYESSWMYCVQYYSEYSLLPLLQRWLVTGIDFLYWCMQELINNSMSLTFFFVFLWGIYTLFRIKLENKKMLYLWIFLPLFFLAFLFHRPNIDRYIMPILPGVAIVSGIGISNIKFHKLRYLLILLIISCGLFQYFAISYKLSFLPQRISLFSSDYLLFNRRLANINRNGVRILSYPSFVDWKTKEILDEILNLVSNKKKISVLFIGDIPEVYEPIVYELYLRGEPIKVLFNSLIKEKAFRDSMPGVDKVAMADCVFLEKNTIYQNSPNLDSFIVDDITETIDVFYKNIDDFYLTKEFELPYANTLLVYKRKECQSYNEKTK